MKKLIVVKATQSRGKSSTLLELVRKIRLDDSFSIYIDGLFYNMTDRFMVASNGIQRMAVITEGDAVVFNEIAKSLQRCRTLNVDVIFAASWTSGYVYNQLYNFAANNGYAFIETGTNYSICPDNTLIARLNDRMADMLLSLANL